MPRKTELSLCPIFLVPLAFSYPFSTDQFRSASLDAEKSWTGNRRHLRMPPSLSTPCKNSVDLLYSYTRPPLQKSNEPTSTPSTASPKP